MKNWTFISIIWITILLIILPLFKLGYIFALDQVFNINWFLPKIWGNVYSIWLISQVFSFFHIPIWYLEKLVILFTFIAPVYWFNLLFQKQKNEKDLRIWILFWVFMLLFNPFLYGRFIDGQINVYLSYSMYPLFFYFLKSGLKNTTIRNLVILWIWSLLLCLTSIHNAMILFFIGIIFSCVYFKKIWLKNLAKIWLTIIVFNLLWIIPFFFGQWEKFQLTQQIDDFWIEHQKAFETQSNNWNIYINALSMHWYWWENQYRFSSTKDINPDYQKLFFILFLIVLIWLYSRIKNKKFWNFEFSLLILAITSFVLSLWTSWNNILSSISKFFYEYLPMYKWFREPQKWIIFVVIFYAYFGSFGIQFLYEKLKKLPLEDFLQKIIIACCITVPIFYSFQTLWWFSGQISIVEYPAEWDEVKEKLVTDWKKDEDIIICKYYKSWQSNLCYNTLSFPWHSYIWIKFTKKVVLWSIVRYFWEHILYGDNVEIWNIYSQSTRPESKIIEKYVWPGWLFKDVEKIKNDELKNFITDIKWLWIQNILFLKEADYKWYKEFLDKLEEQSLINITQENDMIILYKVSSN